MMNKLLFIVSILCYSSIVAQVKILVQFDYRTHDTVPNNIFGINVFQGFDPNQAGTPGNLGYKNAISEMSPGIIRYHNWEMFGSGKNTWIDNNKNWAASKIANALKNSYPSTPAKMMNIPSWPDGKFGVKSNEKLPEDKYQEFADWCAELLKICNIDNNANIKYWEILNERDDTYDTNHAELALIFNRCAEAMKLIDPSIKVGGPAFAQAWKTENVEAFCKGTKSTLDFISYHSYSTGNSNESNQTVYDAANIGWVTGMVKNAWKKYSSREIEYFHDEYNISYNPPDAKQTNYVSQVFDAIAMISLINAGASGGMAWNECDGWYGKMDNSYNKRPSFYLFQNFNRYLQGNVLSKAQCSDPKKVVAFASKNDSCFYLVVVNRADTDLNIEFDFRGLNESVTNNTKVENFESQKLAGIITKTYAFEELVNNGFVSLAGTVALFKIPKEFSTGIQDNSNGKQSSIQFYPNPAHNKVFIKNTSEKFVNEIWIKDISGRTFKRVFTNETQFIDISSFSSGIYFFEYINDGKLNTHKIIKH